MFLFQVTQILNQISTQQLHQTAAGGLYNLMASVYDKLVWHKVHWLKFTRQFSEDGCFAQWICLTKTGKELNRVERVVWPASTNCIFWLCCAWTDVYIEVNLTFKLINGPVALHVTQQTVDVLEYHSNITRVHLGTCWMTGINTTSTEAHEITKSPPRSDKNSAPITISFRCEREKFALTDIIHKSLKKYVKHYRRCKQQHLHRVSVIVVVTVCL